MHAVLQAASKWTICIGETVWYTVPRCTWSLTQTGSGADLAAADAKAAAQELAGKLAMHVVAMRPPYLSRETGGRQAHKHGCNVT
jgi:GH24 family phage-related lysozyme (muramidase)